MKIRLKLKGNENLQHPFFFFFCSYERIRRKQKQIDARTKNCEEFVTSTIQQLRENEQVRIRLVFSSFFISNFPLFFWNCYSLH